MHTFGGRLPRSLVSAMPSASALPCASPVRRRADPRGLRTPARSRAAVGRAVLAAFHLLEAIDAFARDRRRLLRAPCRVAPFHLERGQVELRARRSGRSNCAHGGRDGLAVLACAEIGLAPEPDEEHAFGGDIGHVVQRECGAALAVHVAALEQARERAIRRAIELAAGALSVRDSNTPATTQPVAERPG